uniref:Uncharacterized protein n=1 Tax=Heterorhabditis bacteriophora TaxID=37862 RepID=A0A1I7X4X0_HETBA
MHQRILFCPQLIGTFISNAYSTHLCRNKSNSENFLASRFVFLDIFSDQEMEKLRHAVQRLMVDNEQKSIQITNLRNALDEQERSRSQQDDLYLAPRWEKDHPYDLNTQIRRILLEEPSEPMTHSSSFPVSLCSSTVPSNVRSTVQHSWSQEGTPRHLLHPARTTLRNDALSYRSPSSPAARQLAAELDELRRIGTEMHSNQSYSSASLPRGMGNKVKLLETNIESDDEITRGHNSTGASQSSVREVKPLRRDRTRSSLRNLFSKLTRSTSQDQNGSAFRRGSAASNINNSLLLFQIIKKGFSLTRKRAKNEIYLDPEELLCPVTINHKYPTVRYINNILF